MSIHLIQSLAQHLAQELEQRQVVVLNERCSGRVQTLLVSTGHLKSEGKKNNVIKHTPLGRPTGFENRHDHVRIIIIIIIIIKPLFNEGIHVIVAITLINLWPSTYILRTTKNCIKYMKYINTT